MNANMHQLINDALRQVYDDVPMGENTDLPNTLPHGPNVEAQNF
jgi:hypothetical protein